MKTLLAVIAATLAVLPLKDCSNCEKLTAAAVAACQSQGEDSTLCKEARKAAAEACNITPTPTPPPVNPCDPNPCAGGEECTVVDGAPVCKPHFPPPPEDPCAGKTPLCDATVTDGCWKPID